MRVVPGSSAGVQVAEEVPEHWGSAAEHTPVVSLVDPAGHSKPSAHGPVHPASPMAEVFPKRPGGHAVQAEALLVLYVPAGHGAEVMAALDVMLPGQM